MRGAHSKKRKKRTKSVPGDVVGFFAVAAVLLSILVCCLLLPIGELEELDSADDYVGVVSALDSSKDSEDETDDVALALGLHTRETYKNARFGYSVDVPASFILGSEVDDGSGVMLVSSSLRMTVKITAYNNSEHLSTSDVADELWNHSEDSIVRTEGNRAVIYQYDKEYEYFIWAYVGTESINQMMIRYPLQSDNHDELMVAQVLMENFRPGALDTTH